MNVYRKMCDSDYIMKNKIIFLMSAMWIGVYVLVVWLFGCLVGCWVIALQSAVAFVVIIMITLNVV